MHRPFASNGSAAGDEGEPRPFAGRPRWYVVVGLVSILSGCGGDGGETSAATSSTVPHLVRVDSCKASISASLKRLQDFSLVFASTINGSGKAEIDGAALSGARDRIAKSRKECKAALPECADAADELFDALDGMLDSYAVMAVQQSASGIPSTRLPGVYCEGTEIIRPVG